MKTYLIIGLIVIVALVVGIYLFTKKEYALKESFASPDAAYTIDLYVEQGNPGSGSFTGDADFKKAYVILKNKNGEVLSKPSVLNSCRFTLGDFSLDWNEEGKIYFTKFNYIDLSDHSMNCM
ncbi:hypothetical protein GCM10009117_14150 [Gangjinia marincola]|uniref:C-type lysozyme inhibitor domain-containing protein n=1 Tax=Gangjinia marincola TaxID=578463 RepID=A0ABP3XV81_9FLAO